MQSKPSITEQLPTLGALLRIPLETLLDHVYEELAKAGYVELRVAHGAVFRHISREGSRITALAARARITKQSMAELVEYLRKSGYVELVADPTDGRAKLVRLTARGWKVHRALVHSSEAFERKCARSLGEQRWRQFRELLQEFAACTQHHRERAGGQVDARA
jgi:DNA-binding MarR family transcriptional regulator